MCALWLIEDGMIQSNRMIFPCQIILFYVSAILTMCIIARNLAAARNPFATKSPILERRVISPSVVNTAVLSWTAMMRYSATGRVMLLAGMMAESLPDEWVRQGPLCDYDSRLWWQVVVILFAMPVSPDCEYYRLSLRQCRRHISAISKSDMTPTSSDTSF